MNSSSERLFHLADTYESLSEIPGISFNKLSYAKARVKTFYELVYARKLVKARELQFLGGMPLSRINILNTDDDTNCGQQIPFICPFIVKSHFKVFITHSFHQCLIIPGSETPNFPQLCPPHSHQLR